MVVEKNDKIAILLGCYNGEKYIKDQINSILNQSYNDFTLYIHDDGSVDKTKQIIQEIAKKDHRIKLLEYPKEGIGAMGNFFNLLKRVDSKYYMFSDQDDIWKKDKIAKTFMAIKEEEYKHPNTPIVICTDLIVTDSNMKETSSSYWEYAGIYPEFFSDFTKFAASSVATGCTMLFNQEAKMSAERWSKDKAIMHDAWITLCTIKDGGILKCLKEPLILYRQHGNNTLGVTGTSAKSFGLCYRIKHIRPMFLQNKGQYQMLKSLGYPSLLEFIKNKIAYKKWIKKHEK